MCLLAIMVTRVVAGNLFDGDCEATQQSKDNEKVHEHKYSTKINVKNNYSSTP